VLASTVFGVRFTRPLGLAAGFDAGALTVNAIADLAVESGLAGIVATITTMSRDGLVTPGVKALGSASISGPPVARRAAEMLRFLRLCRRSVDADQCWRYRDRRRCVRASLLQGYTGFIFGGGFWPKHIHDGIARRLREGGFASTHDAVGSAVSKQETAGLGHAARSQCCGVSRGRVRRRDPFGDTVFAFHDDQGD
jgi:dihydroorotate dehydrogenase